MVEHLEATLVDAARAGDQRALDELIARYLPLVYNIVGRALARGADVDDVVQDTMLRVVRGVRGLRDPERFRSWLVAVAMNQVREHRRSGYGAPEPLDEDAVADLADPGADFVDLTLTQLGLSGQRREVARATMWLDDDDRQLLSLWWLEAAGQLHRADLVEALGLDPHHVTVRIARMKGQLEAARLVVRALTSGDYCPGLGEVAATWGGEATPLWRKRFARHVRECGFCPADTKDLIPAERLLAGLALTPLPAGYLAYVLAGAHAASGGAAASAGVVGSGSTAGTGVDADVPHRAGGNSHRHRHRRHGGRARHLSHAAAKPLIAFAAIAAVTGAALVAVYAISPGTRTTADHGPGKGAGAVTGLATPAVSLPPSSAPSASASSAAPTSAKPKPSPAKAAPAKTSARPTPTSTGMGGGDTGSSGQQTPAEQVLALINRARAQAGLPAYTISSGLVTSATKHNQTMAGGCGLSHQCPGEPALGDRETAAGVQWSSAGENIGDGGPVSNTNAAIAQMAVGLTQDMLNEKPPDDGHRQNILSSSFHHVGIAVYRDGSGTVWMTQDFSN